MPSAEPVMSNGDQQPNGQVSQGTGSFVGNGVSKIRTKNPDGAASQSKPLSSSMAM